MRTEYRPQGLLFTPGVALMPADFAGRLQTLKDAAGLPWEGFAARLGVDCRQVLRWRRGAAPCGGAMLAIFHLAATVPSGVNALLGSPAFGPQLPLNARPSDLPTTPGSALMPADFPERLATLRDATGLSWEGFAACIGVDCRQVLRWRQGAEPCGGAMLAICRLTAMVPGGLRALLGDEAFATDAHEEDTGR